MKRIGIDVPWRWFNKYITAEKSAVRDNYVVQYDIVTYKVNMHGAEYHSDDNIGMDSRLNIYKGTIESSKNDKDFRYSMGGTSLCFESYQ